ncbi:hypothetical protein ACWV26_01700 [Rummeliibacillus sp. JY-2-4R]
MNKFLPNLWTTLLLLIVGLLSVVGVIEQIANNPDLYNWNWRQLVMLIALILVYFIFSFVGFYFLISRIKARGICWDSEGVYVDFSHHKIYWYEIEEIHRLGYPGVGKVTVISTSSKYEKDIQHRLDKLKTTISKNSFDILWMTVQKPKAMHEQLLYEFESYKEKHAQSIVK